MLKNPKTSNIVKSINFEHEFKCLVKRVIILFVLDPIRYVKYALIILKEL